LDSAATAEFEYLKKFRQKSNFNHFFEKISPAALKNGKTSVIADI